MPVFTVIPMRAVEPQRLFGRKLPNVSRVYNHKFNALRRAFHENKDPLISKLDILIDNITKIKDAISAEDTDT